MWKTTCIFKAFFKRFSSMFDLKIHAFLDPFCIYFSSRCQKCKTLKTCIFLRENDDFQGFDLPKNNKNQAKNASKWRCQKSIPKTSPKIDLGTHFGLPNPPKIEEKTFKNGVKKKTRKKGPKKCQQDPLRESTSLPARVHLPPSHPQTPPLI